MSSERPIFNPKAPVIDHRRRQWVELDDGWVCVWEMEAADTLFIVERSLRPGKEGGQLSATDAMLWRVLVSCYQGERPDAGRVFDVTDLPRIQKLRKSEWDGLLAAIETVNGLTAAEVAELQDFTPARPGAKRPSSNSSACSSSIG